MPDQEDPFKKYGGKQIDEPQDPFKKYGGQAIAEPVKKKGILSGVGGVALQNGSQGGSSLLSGGGGGVSDLAKGVEKQTPEYKLKQLGLNVTFTPEEPINALQQPKERDFSTTQSALGLDKPQYVNLDDARDVSWLNESIDYNLGKELEKTNMSQARVNKLAQHMGGTEFGKRANDANEIKGILRYKAENNTLRDFYESRLPVPLSDNDLLVGGRHLVGQIDPASEKRNKKILEGGEELGEENDFNIKSLFADVLINNPNTPEADRVKAKELKDNLYATHPKYATAKAWDIISAYNHIKDNRSSGGFWRSRPTVGMVRRWMEEPELKEMFAGNEAAYQIFKEQLDNNFGLAQEGVPNEAVSAMVDNMRADDVAVGGFLNKIGQQAAGTFESIGNIGRSDAKRLKSMMNPTMVRGSFTGNYAMPGMSPAVQSEFFALEQKKKDGELTPEEEEKYKALSKVTGVTDWMDRTLASGGYLTGQVIMQALFSKGIGWAAKPIAGMAGGLARTVNPRAISAVTKSPMGVNAGLSIAATSYDQIRGQSVYNFPDEPEKQNAYTTAMLVANAVSERIFKDEKAVKAFTNAFKKDISSFIASVSARNIAKADIKKKILDKLATFGKQWAIEGGKESSEEAVVQLVDEALQSTMGAEDYDGSKAVKRITDTFLTTLLHGSLVSGLAAKANMNKNQLNKVALYQMVQQPEYYEDYIKRMGEEGNLEKNEVDEKLKILAKGAEIAASEPEKISQQGARKRAEYFTHQLNVALNEEKLANSNDKNEQAEIQKEIKQSEEAAKEVYNSPTVEQEIIQKAIDNKELSGMTADFAKEAVKTPEGAAQLIQSAKDQILNQVASEQGDSRQGALASFGETITNFVSPPTPDLGFDPETNQATSEAKAEQPSTGLSRGDEISVGEMVDKTGTYKGEKGSFYQDGQTVVFKVEGKNKEYELGNINEIKDSPISDFDIAHEESVVSISDNGDIKVREQDYKNNYSNPLAAINKDADGNVVSVNLETADGKKRTFRGNIAEDIAYQIHLKEINKNNETRNEFEQHLNEDATASKEMDNGAVLETSKKEPVKNNEPVSREKIKPKQKPVAKDQSPSSNTPSKPEEQPTASKVAEQPKIDYEAKREEEILDAGKPEISMEFLPAKELVDSKDPIGNKKVHNEIKDRYKKLRELMDCLWAKK